MHQAKLFQSGHHQSVRLPKEFTFEGDRVYIRRIGRAVVLLPMNEPWGTLFDALDQFSPDFMSDRSQPLAQKRDDV